MRKKIDFQPGLPNNFQVRTVCLVFNYSFSTVCETGRSIFCKTPVLCCKKAFDIRWIYGRFKLSLVTNLYPKMNYSDPSCPNIGARWTICQKIIRKCSSPKSVAFKIVEPKAM